MRTRLLIICLLFAGMAYGESSPSSEKKIVARCQGHEMTEIVMGRFETAKQSKERWDERTPYDRSIKECKSEMYREDDEWIIDYSWTHVDDCPKCDKQIVMEVPNE